MYRGGGDANRRRYQGGGAQDFPSGLDGSGRVTPKRTKSNDGMGLLYEAYVTAENTNAQAIANGENGGSGIINKCCPPTKRGGRRPQGGQGQDNNLIVLYTVIGVLVTIVLVGTGAASVYYFGAQKGPDLSSMKPEGGQDSVLMSRLQKLQEKLESPNKNDNSEILKEMQQQLAHALEQNSKLTETIAKQQQSLQQQQQNANTKLRRGGGSAVEVEKLQKRIDHFEESKKRGQEGINQISRELLLQKYGKGPHRVDIKVRDFVANDDPDDSTSHEIDDGIITIELASDELMPHTTLWFLEQVTRGLYNGCSFYRNAGHIVQGGPVHNRQLAKVKSSGLPPAMSLKELDDRFTKAGYHSILYQEYSEAHPHSEYTVGYAGRPGGPDFYINIQDNTKIHGPGGQNQYDDRDEADPCFGRVVKGKEVIDKIHRIPTIADPEANQLKILMERFVVIVWMHVVHDEDEH